MQKRFFIDIAVVLGILIFPWWIAALAIVVLSFYFENWYESLFFGLMLDSLYSVPLSRWNGFEFVFTVAFAVVFVVSGYARLRLKFH